MPATLPLDVFDQILNHIDDPCDVLNLALSNKTLYSVAVPRHLHYRDICTPLYNLSLWTLLSINDDIRASQIRSLSILPDSKYDAPSLHPWKFYDTRKRLDPDFIPDEPEVRGPDLDVDKYINAEDIMISALERMVCLRRFVWYRAERPHHGSGDDLWTTLQNLGTVKEIDIYENNKYRPSLGLFPIISTGTVSHYFNLL